MNESIVILNQNNPVRRRRLRIKIYLISMVILLFLIGLFYLINYSPIFQIKEYRVLGSQRLSDEAILQILEPKILQSKMDNFLGFKNLLVWGKIPDMDRTALLSVNLNRDWLRQNVIIKVKERDRLAIWCGSNYDCYWIDNEATAFEPAPETEGSLVLTVNDSQNKNIVLGNKVIEERVVKNLNIILNAILELKIPVKKIVFERRLLDLKLESYSGPDLLFSIRFDPSLNIASLKSVLETADIKRMQYVDLRVENRIYYKNN